MGVGGPCVSDGGRCAAGLRGRRRGGGAGRGDVPAAGASTALRDATPLAT